MSQVIVVRAVNAQRQSHNGFQYPETGHVEAPDWQPTPECGNGLHGLEWGLGDWAVVPTEPGTLYQAIAVEDENLVRWPDRSKVKFRAGDVIYTGSLAGVFDVLRKSACPWMREGAAGNGAPASTAGDRAPASTAGDRAPASTAGHRAPASTAGDGAPASTAGYGAPASTAGYGAPASTAGKHSVAACLGRQGRARCGVAGAVILVHYDSDGRPWPKVKTDCIPGQWYRLDDSGEIVEAEP